MRKDETKQFVVHAKSTKPPKNIFERMNFPYLRRFCSDQIPPARLSLSPPAGAESPLLYAPVRPELDDHEVGGAREGAVDDGNPGWTENGG